MLKSSKVGNRFQMLSGKFFSSMPLTANQLTFLSIPVAAAGFAFAYLGNPACSLLLFVVAGLIDAIDGAVARARNEASARGAYIDGISDRLVEFFIICSLFLLPFQEFVLPNAVWLLAILFFGSCMTSFATAYADHRKVAGSRKIGAQPGIFPRAERVASLYAAFLLAIFAPAFAAIALALSAALCTVTFAQRFSYFAA
jgi:phosphatidylglycerophosphate synthase